MKRKNKKPTRNERDKRGDVPQQHTCQGCGFKAPSRFALKEHRLDCRKG